MSRGAWMPMRTFSPMIDSTETSMSSPIMIDLVGLACQYQHDAASLAIRTRSLEDRPAPVARKVSYR